MSEQSRCASATPHDEAFKKLLQTFFEEFIALFFPEVHQKIDYSKAKLLMQEQLVDIVGQDARTLDLLLEAQLLEEAFFVLIHFEPQSYRDDRFAERMFIYFSRLYERYRKTHKRIIPIAVFTADSTRIESDRLTMPLPGSDEDVLQFKFLKVELKSKNWRDFAESDNPVAAALLAKMGYNRKEKRELRFAYLRTLLKLKNKLDPARMALIMSVADLYYEPKPNEDEQILLELIQSVPEEEKFIMELMPAWKRWGFEEGIEQGIEQGKERWKQEERREIVRKLVSKGMTPEFVANMLDWPLAEVNRLNDAD
ncbi:Rpn family recombination-promoting nuclease/putative transposase [Cohnella sp. GbtcB17]|uniref:Rpn family recombination-promoting nuclease/putative transposase n=1 Tax=Cohnella sp. GbtcB17 TaxID=2824762 RepID=UPI001C2F18BC|nr:Rpn family recombination-promoting nuclease/putative transposase [Cohnella sp. GbtcB17]